MCPRHPTTFIRCTEEPKVLTDEFWSMILAQILCNEHFFVTAYNSQFGKDIQWPLYVKRSSQDIYKMDSNADAVRGGEI